MNSLTFFIPAAREAKVFTGKKIVKEFMKHVHPDFFANAPKEIRDANQSGVQEINEYI